MKSKNSISSFLCGAFVALLLVGLVLPTAAVSAGKNVTIYPGVNIYIDDQKLNPKDVNGNPVEVFVYNGSTYLPVRAVSEALGKPVQWEGSTSSVYIGKHTGSTPAAWISEMDCFQEKGVTWKIGKFRDNLNEEHEHCLSGTGNKTISSRIYILNGQYNRITGNLFQKYEERSREETTTYTIYADGVKVWSDNIGGGVQPKNFDVIINHALELKIECDATEFWCYGILGDVGLWI